MSEYLKSLLEDSVSRALGEEGGYRAAPYLSRPVPQLDRPVPSPDIGGSFSSDFPTSVPSQPTTDTSSSVSIDGAQTNYTGDRTISGTGQPISSNADKGLTIDVVSVPSASAVASAKQMSGLTGKVVDKAAGMVPTYNPVTGLVSTSPPNMSMLGAGFMGTLASVSAGVIKRKQEQAAVAASRGQPNSGLVSVNGRTIAVIDGQIYGVMPEDVPFNEVKKEVLNFISTKNPVTQLAGALNRKDTDLSTVDTENLIKGAGQKQGFTNNNNNGDRDRGASAGPRGDAYSGRGPGGFFGLAKGGRVGMANGDLALEPGQAGFVDGPPEQFTKDQTVADTENGQVQEGSFVINAPAVEFAGSDDIRKMILAAYATAKEKGLDIGNVDRKLYEETVDVALSKGEVVVPPALVKIIGLDRLRKINNRGKREVDDRQQNMRKGGFIEGYADGDVVEGPYGGFPALQEAYSSYKNKFSSPKAARKVTAQLIQNLPAEDVLALIMMGEASVLGDEGMRGVAHVLVNRTNSDYEDFAKQGDIHTAALTKTGSGIYLFNALEPTTFRRTLKDITQTDYGRAKYERVRNDAEEILSGVQEDFTRGSLFFWNPKTSTDASFKNKVKSGQWIPQGQTRTKSGMHEYLAPRM